MQKYILIIFILIFLIPLNYPTILAFNEKYSDSDKSSIIIAKPLIPKVSHITTYDNAQAIQLQDSRITSSQEPTLEQAQTKLQIEYSFEGVRETSSPYNGYPPDPNLAVGINHIIEIVNRQIVIYDKSGNLIKSQTLYDFFGFPTSYNVGDPRVVFDLQSQRWFVVASAFNAGLVRIAVSKTSDPTGDWWIYELKDEQGYCTDYPMIGYSDDKVAVSLNIFSSGCNNPYLRVRLWILNKNQLISGSPSVDTYTTTFSPNHYFTIYPAKSLSTTSTLYMVSDNGGDTTTIQFFKITGNPSNNDVTISEIQLTVPYIYQPVLADQPNTSIKIQTNDARIIDASWYQGLTWFSLNTRCIPQGDSSTRACIRIISIDTQNNLINSDTTISEANKHYFYPALSIDQNGNVIIVYGFSSTSDYPGLKVTALLKNNWNSWLTPIDLRSGVSIETRNRYGDYFGAAIDPQDKTKEWVVGEYMPNMNSWGTYIGKVTITTPSIEKVTLTVSYAAIGDSGYSPPIFSYVFNGLIQTATLTTTPTSYLVDKNSKWNVTDVLNGSTDSMRWATGNQTSGIASSSATLRFVYYQQYRINILYKMSDASPYIPPNLNYTSFGNKVSSVLPVDTWADKGTDWSITNPLKGSSNDERWMSKDTTSGVINNPISIQIKYYHQYRLTFSFAVIGGGNYTNPSVTYYQFDVRISKTIPLNDWLDSNSTWTIDNPLKNSNAKERWSGNNSTSGVVTSSKNLNFIYYHQYYITLNLKMIGGESPTNPIVEYYRFGILLNQTVPTSTWADANTTLKILPVLKGSSEKERWITLNSAYLITKSETLDVTYYRQFMVNITFKVVNGEAVIAPIIYHYYLGNKTQDNLPFNSWIDAMTYINVTNPVQLSTKERLFSPNSTTVFINNATILNLLYWKQYLVTIELNLIGTGNISPWITYISAGQSFNSTLPLSDWIDANTTAVHQTGIYYSNNERWISYSTPKTLIASPMNLKITYYHQYLITIEVNPSEGGTTNIESGWFNESSTIKLSATANNGWKFIQWIGEGPSSYSGESETIEIQVKSSIHEVAVFYVVVTIDNSFGLTIEYKYDSSQGIITNTGRTLLYIPKNTSLELTAKPSIFLFNFNGWSGYLTSSDNNIKIMIDKPLILQTKSSLNYFIILIIISIIVAAVYWYIRKKKK